MTHIMDIYNAVGQIAESKPRRAFTFSRNLTRNGNNTSLTFSKSGKEVILFEWHSERESYLAKHNLGKTALREFSDLCRAHYPGRISALKLLAYMEMVDNTIARRKIIDDILADLE